MEEKYKKFYQNFHKALQDKSRQPFVSDFEKRVYIDNRRVSLNRELAII